MDKPWPLLPHLLWQLAELATQIQCKCLISKNCILSNGWSICFHVHITLLANTKSAQRDFAQHAMVTLPNLCTGYRITVFILSLEII